MVADMRKRNSGSQMAAMMNHEPPKLVRDHAKGNVQSLRQLQDKVREKKLEDAQKKVDENNKWKMRQFENIPSRCREDPEKIRSQSKQKREEMLEQREAQQERKREAQYDEGGDTHPDAFKNRNKSGDGNRNFVSENRKAAQEIVSRPHQSKKDNNDVKTFDKTKNGVPTYLNDIKAKLDDDKRKANEKVEEIPPGYRLMGEAEKQKTLKTLRERQADAEAQWRKLPLNIETEGQKRRETNIKNELKEVERMTAMFDKPRVLVEM